MCLNAAPPPPAALLAPWQTDAEVVGEGLTWEVDPVFLNSSQQSS